MTQNLISRRNLLTVGAASLAAGACAKSDTSPNVVEQSPKRDLVMTTAWPKGLAGLQGTAEYIANRVSILSNNSISVQVYAAGELVPPLQAFDAVADGSVHMSHTASGYWASLNRAFPIFTTVPLGLTVSEMLAWLKFGGGQELWDELAGQYGVKSIPAGTTGVQMAGFFRDPVENLDDFRSLQYRISGLGAEVVRAVGGSAVTIAGGDVFTSLQTGVIDAAEFAGPWIDRSLGLGRVAPYYYGPGFHEPGSIMSLDINRDLWDNLTKEQQLLIESVCSDACALSLAQFQHFNSVSLQAMIEEDGIELRSFPDDVIEAIQAAVPIVMDELASKGELENRIVNSYREYARSGRAWTAAGDGQIINLRAFGG